MYKIALLGQPNSGKSTLFNALTGSHQHVGNWPGKTVERCEGSYKYQGETISVVDLPGSYSLTADSEEEKITRDFITQGDSDLILVMADSSQLSRSLYMLADFSKLDAPAVLILNMEDVAKAQGKQVNAKLLEERLGIPVISFVAADLKRYDKLKDIIHSALPSAPKIKIEKCKDGQEFSWIKGILSGAVKESQKPYTLGKFDRMAIGRISGKIIACGAMLLAFAFSMIVAAPLMGIGAMIPQIFTPLLQNAMDAFNVYPFVAGIISILIPNTIYFAFSMSGFVFGVNFVFAFLEDIGYIARVAYVFDGLMSKLGVQGKSICPMIMGFGCTIGGAAGARVIDNYGQRLLTIALTWAVPCAAIWSVVPVLAAYFFGSGSIMVVLGILAYMMLMIFVISKVFGRKLSPAETRIGLIMELPPYHKPHWKNILYIAWIRAIDIFKRALRTIFLISLIVYLLTFSRSGNVENSILYHIGTFIEPVTGFFGMGWQTFMAFIASAFAKEAVLGVLNAVFAGQGSLIAGTFEAKSFGVDSSVLATVMPTVISKAEALAFLFAVSFNVPCVMALSTTYRETHSLKWTLRLALFFTGSALILSCIIYHVAEIFLS
ncbi:MAG: ferrous iron transporter B [Oscillospiraceae bacterium]|nr:ferrous iron transporter B [Oscillospiraceae bacterium]